MTCRQRKGCIYTNHNTVPSAAVTAVSLLDCHQGTCLQSGRVGNGWRGDGGEEGWLEAAPSEAGVVFQEQRAACSCRAALWSVKRGLTVLFSKLPEHRTRAQQLTIKESNPLISPYLFMSRKQAGVRVCKTSLILILAVRLNHAQHLPSPVGLWAASCSSLSAMLDLWIPPSRTITYLPIYLFTSLLPLFLLLGQVIFLRPRQFILTGH